jgi:hypothetical protein
MGLKGSLNVLGKQLYHNRANIAFYAGTALNVVGIGLFIRATHKNEPVITDHKLKMAITPEDDKESRRKICKNTAVETVKNYAAPTLVTAASYGLQFYANNEHNKDLSIANAALTSATLAYETLKEKIIATDGAEKWDELNGITTEEIVDEETGEITEETHFDKEGLPLYSVLFDEVNQNYQKYPGANRRFLVSQMKNVQFDLGNKKIILLTDVLKNYLGYSLVPDEYFSAKYLKSITNAGWFIGDAEDPTTVVNFFGKGAATERFMKDAETCVLLEFNCRHDVYEAYEDWKKNKSGKYISQN